VSKPPVTDPVTAYAQDVVDGRLAAGRPVRLQCQRHLDDLARQGTPAFPYVFVPGRVEIMLEFFRDYLTLDDTDANGKPLPFALVRWLLFAFGSMQGWVHQETGFLRFVEGYFETAKGSTKTPAAAGYGAYRLVGENRFAVEIYSLGVNGDQANYLYGFAKRMFDRSPDLKDLLDVGEYNTAWIERNSFFRPLTSEGRSLDNKRVFTALIDELHEHPTAVIPEKMRLGIKSQVDGQILMLTNAGFDKTSVCWSKHDYGIKVLEGTIVDEEFFAYICQLDPCEECRSNGATQPADGCPRCDDWTDERHWPKVNPALPDIPQLYTYMRGVARQAINQPSTQPRIKRLNFCIWTQGHSVWIPVDKWDACKVAALATKHDGRACAAGFDMSEKSDLTACAIALRIDDPNDAPGDAVEIVDSDNGQEIRKTLNINFCVELQTFFWLPRDTLIQRAKDEHIPLDLWERIERAEGPGRGLRVTHGPVIDYDLIYDQFRQDIAPAFKPDRVGYDKHNASQFALQLRDKAKFTVAEVPQGRALSESFKLFDALVRLRRIRHLGNPVMAWCVSNAEPKRDRYENLWLEKPSQTKRIDGVIAAVIALNQLVGLPAKRRTSSSKGVGFVYTPQGMVPILSVDESAGGDSAVRP
jgi:phage terminase large subunit-like protein